jgi:hypothetical protein
MFFVFLYFGDYANPRGPNSRSQDYIVVLEVAIGTEDME